MYVPGVEDVRAMAPVVGVRPKPEVEENVPPAVPVTVAVGAVMPLAQNVAPL